MTLDLWSAAAATSSSPHDAWDGRLPGREDRAPSFVPRPYQVEARAAVRSMWSANGPDGQQPMLVQWTACHAAGQRLLMFDGSVKLVEDVRVGDRLMGPDSTPRTVLKLYRGEDDIVEVRPTKGEPWRVNKSHILTLVRTNLSSKTASDWTPWRQGGQIVDVPADEWASWSKGRKHVHKLLRVGVEFPAPTLRLPIDPYFLGVLLGDGTLERSPAVTTADPEIVEVVQEVAASYGLKVRRHAHGGRCPTYFLTHGNGIRRTDGGPGAGRNRLMEDLRVLGFEDARCETKFIPQLYKVASRVDRLALLAGLVDTDGHLSCGGYDFISASRQLADDVAFVARSCWFAAYVKAAEKYAQTGGGGIYWRVHVSGDVAEIPVRLERKKAAPRTQKKDVLRTGLTVIPCGYRAPYFGFELDGDHRYLLDDFTVTHNTGKTLTALFIAQDFLAAGQRVVWLADKQELLSQPLADLNRHWPRVKGGIVQAKKDVVDAQFVFLSVDTARVTGRTERVLEHGYPALIVVDEAHGSLAPKFRKALEKLRGPDTVMLALTATPDRADGGDLSVLWEIAFTYGPTEAIDAGWVVPPYAVVDKLARLDETIKEAHVPVNADGEYDEEALGKALMLAGVVEWTVAAMSKTYKAKRLPFRDDEREMTARGRFPMVFCASVEQCERTCEALRADGWEARFITGTTPDRDRARLLDMFKKGKIECLVNVGTLTTGTDVPRSACSVFARPMKSWVLYCQSLGRSSRIFCPTWRNEWGFCNALDPRYRELGGKIDCFVLDLAGASSLHSIVSAPILIGGSRCPEADDGVHDYQPVAAPLVQGTDPDTRPSPKGVCAHCNRQIPCIASLSPQAAAMGSKKDGRHDWFDVDETNRLPGMAIELERACRFCGSPQCSRSPNGRHVWAVLDVEQSVLCVECDAEMPFRGDALASLVGKKSGEVPPEGEWLRVNRHPAPTGSQPATACQDLVPETYVCDVDGQGLVLVVGDRTDGRWWPFWVRKGAKRARPLASGPVAKEDVRLRCADLLRRVRRGGPGGGPNGGGRMRRSDAPVTAAQLEYGRQLGIDLSRCPNRGAAGIEITRAHAWQRAIALGLAKPASSSTNGSTNGSNGGGT